MSIATIDQISQERQIAEMGANLAGNLFANPIFVQTYQIISTFSVYKLFNGKRPIFCGECFTMDPN